ncbi:hypothetical protein VTL71DRAFT_6701 [Oculimacula yallundae]|uniref:MUC1 Extracellular alpha-1,4-glucan glucosidase n=1 Tax=Oculimacula yallundae TaxID=86028 RepID=A0ABR4BXU9_9HELO
MFGNKNRRRRAASNPPLNGTNTNPSAATAAAQAFLKNQASNASLSSAAAAAALRSRPTTPTSVADVETKRTIRRNGSVSSIASSVAGSTKGQSRPQLERRGSNSSMSERTFRDPSPSRPVPSAVDAPPVPALPKNIPQAPLVPQKSHRRAASMEAPPMRVASPPPNKANGRGSSLGGATQPPRRTNQRMSNLSSVAETERPASRGANIARIVSPTNQNLIYDPNTRSFLPEAQILAIEERIHSASQQPVKKKKRAPAAAGTHLADGTAGGRPKGTFIDAMEVAEQQKVVEKPAPSQPAPVPIPAPIQAPAEKPVADLPKKKKKKKVVMTDSDSDQASYVPNSSDNDSDFSTQQFNTRAGSLLAKKPSIVREDKQREEDEDDTPKRLQNLAPLDTTPEPRHPSPSPLPRSSMAGRGHGRGQASASAAFAQGRQQARSASQPAPNPESPTTEGVGLVSRDSVRGGRVQSVSPMRTTHFASTPENLVVKHQPPARSISPRKSAMKHSNSPRAGSPIDGLSGANETSFSETSNGSAMNRESLAPRKKANRVSFDEHNVVVGQASTPVASDSPVVLSPQTKSKWFSIGRGKKKEVAVVDDDEVMKPRPALPSFGSVREKKPVRDLEERPLVKPADSTPTKLPPASPPLFTSPTGEIIENPFGQSNDHGAGAIIAQDAASKNTANISKSREPLPPQVTSVEGNGENSDSDSSLYSVENRKSDVGVARANSVKRGPADGDADTYRALASPLSNELDTPTEKGENEAMNGSNVPEINIMSATPTIASAEFKKEWPDIPGSWGKESSDSSSQDQEESTVPIVEHHATEPTLAEQGITEPDPTTPRAGSPVLGEIAAYNSILEEPEESDASIYSDAAEDFSDAEGDGFMSLDAVVTTPVINTKVPGLAISTPPDSPTTKVTKQKAYQRSQLSRKSSEPDMDEGWDKVQAYWSTLSADKKRQLEQEAREEAEGSDTEVEAKPTPKPKKKKKAAVRTAPNQPEPEQQRQLSNERSYMIQPGAKAGPNGHAPMKTSMRAEPASADSETHIRKSMRGPGSMRSSLRAEEEPRGALQKKIRPMSQPAAIRPDPIEVKKHIRNLSAASAATAQSAAQRDTAPKPALRRKGSGDSDTSFKRAKRGNEIPSFRSSMRGSTEIRAAPRAQSPAKSSRFSLRSLSPTGSAFRRPFNSGAAPQVNLSETHMRNSMRNSYDNTPSLRNKAPAKKASGFGRSAPQKSKQKPTRRLASRFADSSDEDEDQPRFQSRFNDSSDDEEPVPLPPAAGRTMRNSAPVRGIPKRSGVNDGDSSDLPDSDDEKATSPGLKLTKRQNGNGTTAPASKEGTTLASGSLRRSGSGRGTISSPTIATTDSSTPIRPGHSRRGSFMSILRRKKPDAGSRVRKSDAESPARRDTPLERSKSDLQALKTDQPGQTMAQSPRLQKRNPMSRENSASWPLPAGPAAPAAGNAQSTFVGKEGEDGRPFTADGPDGGEAMGNVELGRPDIGTRRYTATGLAGVDVANLSLAGAGGIGGDAGKKKKKFGKLRKMFRLDD